MARSHPDARETGRGHRWWDLRDDSARLSDARHPLDHDVEATRAGEQAGVLRRFCRNGMRAYLSAVGGSGTADIVRLKNGIEIDVNNFVLPSRHRRTYIADESLVLLRASLSCDVVFRRELSAPIELNRPEVTMVCLPKGMKITVDARGGVRQQGMYGIFRSHSLMRAYGLRPEDLPDLIRDAVLGRPSFGRLVSLPLDHRIASLVADTIETPLQGEMRALLYASRMAELVAYTLDAVRRSEGGDAPERRGATAPGRGSAGVPGWKDADLAYQALGRLARQYRDPPLFDQLATDLGTNPNKLKSAFKAVFGVTMAGYCIDRRMREAQQLLLEGKLTIGGVAERVGYAHQSNFTAAFTAHVGMAPKEYRRCRAPIRLSLTDMEAEALRAGTSSVRRSNEARSARSSRQAGVSGTSA